MAKTRNNLRTCKVSDFEEWVVCSSGIAAAADIHQPDDLATLPYIANAAFADKSHWEFSKGKTNQDIKLEALLVLNATTAILGAVSAGDAFAILPDFLVRDSVNKGLLDRLLPDWSLRKGGIYSVTPPVRYQPAATRKFVKFVVDHHRKIREAV